MPLSQIHGGLVHDEGDIEGPPIDGQESAVGFYQEVADKLRSSGPSGLAYLWDRVATADAPRTRALVLR